MGARDKGGASGVPRSAVEGDADGAGAAVERVGVDLMGS